LARVGRRLEFNEWFIGRSWDLNKENVLLTEATVEKSFRKLMSSPNRDEAVFEKAEDLLEELRCESPLRHRLSQELEELRAQGTAKA
jgi:hypothetical protein